MTVGGGGGGGPGGGGVGYSGREVTAFVSNVLIYDKTLWHLWLMGLSVDQAAQLISKHGLSGGGSGPAIETPVQPSSTFSPPQQATTPALPQTASSFHADVQRNFITTQYRNFEMLESYLHQPKTLSSQMLFPLLDALRTNLITSYYSFDQGVMREILGKKLSSRLRKELDEVCFISKVPLGGCRRMFDNLKRILKCAELYFSEGYVPTGKTLGPAMINAISSEFLIPKDLASMYANIIFINNFRMDTTKKKLAHYKFSDFEFVASVFMEYFSSSGPLPLDDLDSGLAADARDLRTLINSKEVISEYHTLVQTHLSPGSRCIDAGLPLFKIFLRNLFILGSGLSYSKELRDMFTGIQEKIIEPALMANLSHVELEDLLIAIGTAFPQLSTVQPHYKKRFEKSVHRIVNGLRICAGRMFATSVSAKAEQQ